MHSCGLVQVINQLQTYSEVHQTLTVQLRDRWTIAPPYRYKYSLIKQSKSTQRYGPDTVLLWTNLIGLLQLRIFMERLAYIVPIHRACFLDTCLFCVHPWYHPSVRDVSNHHQHILRPSSLLLSISNEPQNHLRPLHSPLVRTSTLCYQSLYIPPKFPHSQ